MLEIKPNEWLIINKIIKIKIASKENKHWVVFHCGKVDGHDQDVFSAPYDTIEAAKAFAMACGQSC